jgi:peptide/nickel transport system permease protein
MSREQAKTPGGESFLETVFRRLIRDRAALTGTVIILALIVLAVFAPWVTRHDPIKQDFNRLLKAPSWEHPLGTDQYGRDVLTRIVYGCRYALIIGLAVSAIHLVIGVVLGLLAGYYGGWVETVIMRLTDVMLSIPSVVLAVVLAGFLGGGVQNVIIAVGAIGWRAYTRLVRAEVLSTKEETFVEAARAIGCSDMRIMFRHVLPYTLGPVIAYTSLGVATAILWAAALSFLGLGAQPPTPEWGAMLADGREYMADAWWIATFPGLAIMVTVLGFNFFGDALRDTLDPRAERRLRG